MKILLVFMFLLVVSGCATSNTAGINKSNEVDHSMMNHEMMVSSDREFIEMMIPHHQEAVDSSRLMLKKTQNAELKEFLNEVVEAQTKEIAEMREWYGEWFGEEYSDGGMYMPMMPELEVLDGEAADQAYISGMIGHHQGAIKMAEQLQKFTKREELQDLAEQIIKAQSSEIDILKSWLK
jgi:uncharacterized protein (DUF305 family)